MEPSLARNLVTALSGPFTTQMLSPSKARPSGELPAGKLCTLAEGCPAMAVHAKASAAPNERMRRGFRRDIIGEETLASSSIASAPREIMVHFVFDGSRACQSIT